MGVVRGQGGADVPRALASHPHLSPGNLFASALPVRYVGLPNEYVFKNTIAFTKYERQFI